jgi:hypothetical protein
MTIIWIWAGYIDHLFYRYQIYTKAATKDVLQQGNQIFLEMGGLLIRRSHNLQVYHVSFFADECFWSLCSLLMHEGIFWFILYCKYCHGVLFQFLFKHMGNVCYYHNRGMRTSQRAKQLLIVWVHYILVESKQTNRKWSHCSEKQISDFFTKSVGSVGQG